MKLEEWVKQGGCMLSNYTSAWCCQVARINERQLRQMSLDAIYAIPHAGEVARREIARFKM